ncbi:MAG: hypothetical protein C0617_11310 [Desulfuromonas sp.]|uniref:TVP38/TMEM64 family protein n=1 Tax=Desulfuromonas sp. TaxID=892 RepID=UPI000CC16D39|nr:TVP38/TMEM64 family protein [Desulfuromonas sp.]PLX83508.1 MAG: hypothetical protein C0617_11310 [Desulfuromonas sp.]
MSETSSKAGLKFALLILFLAALVALAKFTGVGSYLSQEQLGRFLEQAGFWAPLIYIVLYIVFTVFAFPGVVLTIAGALAFGALPATLYIVAGATIGACGCFLMARTLGRDFVARFLRGGKLKDFDESIEKHGLKILFIMRLIPLFPFNGINFGAGLSKVSFRYYFISTALGIIPGTFAYCYLTEATQKAAGGGWRAFLTPDFLLPLGLFLVMVVVLPLVYKKMRKGKEGP